MSKNGYLLDSELTYVDGGIRLSNATARQWLAMKAAAAKQGVALSIVHSYNNAAGYRPWAIQVDMRAHPGNYNITPGIISGLPSNHGFGTCIDVAAGVNWVRTNGHLFGFSFPVSNDPNHIMYNGIVVSGGGTPIPTPVEKEPENDMATPIILRSNVDEGGDGRVAAFGSGVQNGFKVFGTPTDYSEFAAVINGLAGNTQQPGVTVIPATADKVFGISGARFTLLQAIYQNA